MQNLTLIVGSGPAGASCAWKLAFNKVPCLMIDKTEFPREKVCGGALSARASDILITSGILSSKELEDLTLREHRTMSFWNGDNFLRTFTSQGSPVRIVSRKEFDSALVEKAASAGAEIITGDAVISVDSFSVTTLSGKSFSFSNLVGADGCGSIVRKFISGKTNRKTGLGLEYFIPLSDFGETPEDLQIHFGSIPYGYIWVFPGSEKVCVGAGAIGSPASPSDVIRALKEFLEVRGISFDKYELRGAPIPSLVLDRNLGSGNIYLAGDAAGMVDQISGEGIGYAVQSGFLVADCILSGGNRKVVLKSRKKCSMNILRQSMFYRHLLYSPITRGTAMMELRDNKEFARGYWNIISGKVNYNEMFSRILT